MNNLCKHCGICCKLIPIDPEKNVILRDGIQNLDEDFKTQLVKLSIEEAKIINKNYVENIQELFPNANFFSCKHLSIDNLCTSFEKHELCKRYPETPIAIIPEDCGYYGEIFIKLEEVKQKVRKYKEEIIYYEALINSGCKEEKVYYKIIDSLNKFIEKYIPFGAENW